MAVTLDSTLNRRAVLAGLAVTAVSALTPTAGAGQERAIERLIGQAQAYPDISQRIDVISHALLGRRYKAYPLIGGPRRAEVFVSRDDRFDCVTFCETVLAAARAHDLQSFDDELRAIRYHNGVVDWRERNHDFAAWSERNIAGGAFRRIDLGQPVELRKTLDTPRALGRRSYVIAATPSVTLLAEKAKLQPGDVVGFVSRRSWLDYFHIGFLTFDGKGDLMLRDASQSRGRVTDRAMKAFLAANRVRYVTVLRPQDVEKIA